MTIKEISRPIAVLLSKIRNVESVIQIKKKKQKTTTTKEESSSLSQSFSHFRSTLVGALAWYKCDRDQRTVRFLEIRNVNMLDASHFLFSFPHKRV